jgi:hypothetical protein
MAAKKKHGKTPPTPQFCVVRKPNQECGCPENNNYSKHGKAPADWHPFKYTQTATDKDTGKKILRVVISQAHHIVCCSSSQKLLASRGEVKRIVEATQWCVNKKINIKPLPLWGNTLKYYCTVSATAWALKRVPPKEPPFANLPQHDSDHPRYTKEVNTDIEDLKENLKKKAKAHELTSAVIVKALNSLITDTWEPNVRARGERGTPSGTHEAWKQGKAQRNSKWYLPFSMAATDDATPRTFPLAGSDSSFLEKLEKMMQAIKRWGF